MLLIWYAMLYQSYGEVRNALPVLIVQANASGMVNTAIATSRCGTISRNLSYLHRPLDYHIASPTSDFLLVFGLR